MKKWFFLFALFFFQKTYAADLVSGIGLVKIDSKHFCVELHQAIKISEKEAFFVALDDFGGIAFRVDFTAQMTLITLPDQSVSLGDRKLKQILSLPLTRDEFLSLIQYRKPESFSNLESLEKDTEVWQNKSRKKLRVAFSDFPVLATEERYPGHIVISYKKNHFDLKWQSLETR